MGVSRACPTCGTLHNRSHAYCAPCFAAFMRAWRKAHPLNADQKRKDNSRSIAAVYKRRGKIVRKPCEWCGSRLSQMHHDDYDKPLKVRWFCRPCHLALHQHEQKVRFGLSS